MDKNISMADPIPMAHMVIRVIRVVQLIRAPMVACEDLVPEDSREINMAVFHDIMVKEISTEVFHAAAGSMGVHLPMVASTASLLTGINMAAYTVTAALLMGNLMIQVHIRTGPKFHLYHCQAPHTPLVVARVIMGFLLPLLLDKVILALQGHKGFLSLPLTP